MDDLQFKQEELRENLPQAHVDRVNSELRRNGAVAYNMWLPETHYLPHIILDDEHVMGAVFGHYKDGRGMLVATDKRIIFIDKKPLFVRRNDVTYNVVSGVSRTKVGLIGTVILSTRQGEYKLRTYNQKNAKNFVNYVSEKHLSTQ